jgi:DNA-binding LytR/AlgR family response regulator
MMRKKSIFLRSSKKLIRIEIGNLLYVAALREYTQLFLHGQQKPLIILNNLTNIEKVLSQYNFVRVHRSYIVCIDHIDHITKDDVFIGNIAIPIGNYYRNSLNEAIEKVTL